MRRSACEHDAPLCLPRAETVSTLKFAHRAKAVRNAASVNEDGDSRTLLRKYESELRRLRAELQQRQREVVDKRHLLVVRRGPSAWVARPGFDRTGWPRACAAQQQLKEGHLFPCGWLLCLHASTEGSWRQKDCRRLRCRRADTPMQLPCIPPLPSGVWAGHTRGVRGARMRVSGACMRRERGTHAS